MKNCDGLTSRRAAERAMKSVNHHTAAPMGSVMSRAVPASVPASKKGQTARACDDLVMPFLEIQMVQHSQRGN